MNDQALLKTFFDTLSDLQQAENALSFAAEQCAVIGHKSQYTQEEQIWIDALTSRFARLADILMQKALKNVDFIDLEEPGSLRDILNRAEKKGLIPSAEQMIAVRLLRNRIAHDYASDHFNDIYAMVMQYLPTLTDSIKRIIHYAQVKYGLVSN